MKTMKKLLCVALGAIMLVCCAACQGGAKYPTKNIDLVCPGSAGSGGDVCLRVIAAALSEELGVTVNVINTSGGNGIPAVTSVLDAASDGYTLMGDQGYSSSYQCALEEVPYDVFDDRDYICMVATGPNIICGSPDYGWEDLNDVVQWVKDNPDETLLWGGVGPSSGANFSILEFMLEAGIDVSKTKEIRYGGGGEVLSAIAGGHVMLGAAGAGAVASYVQDNMLVPLCVAGSKRLDTYPDLPCAEELGYKTITTGYWQGLSGSSDLPEEVKDVLKAACKKLVDDPAFNEKLAAIGATSRYMDGQDFVDYLHYEAEKVEKLTSIGK